MDSLCIVLIWICSMTCRALAGTDCTNPVTPQFGNVTVTTTGAILTATYTCDSGYIILGDETRDCGDHQTWDGSDPECRVYLPDLTVEPARTRSSMRVEHRKLKDMVCALEEGCASSSAYDIKTNSTEWSKHKRILLRFSTSAWNFGVRDFVSTTDPSLWEWHQCHDHFHSMENFAHYDILNSTGDMAAEGHKASFCLADTVCITKYRRRHRCDSKTGQGISVGCTDIYNDVTDCQWIDMTDVVPGNYTFQTHVNPYRIVPELSYDNNILNCDIYFDGEDVDVGSCNIAGSNIGDSCETNSSCTYHNSVCSNNTCGCKEGTRPYEVTNWYTVCTADCDHNEAFVCQNGGTRSCPLCLECVSHASYKCTCPYGYHGVYCEVEYDPNDCHTFAARRYCKNKSKCVDGVQSYTCNCTGTGYTGPQCNEELLLEDEGSVDHCLSNPCGIDFTCSASDTGYSCSCAGTLKGGLCLAFAPVSGTGKILPSLIVLLIISLILH